MSKHRETNQTAFRRLKSTIDGTYAPGRFVAIDQGRIVADAATFEELRQALGRQGLHSPDVLAVQAGHDYPDYVDILI